MMNGTWVPPSFYIKKRRQLMAAVFNGSTYGTFGGNVWSNRYEGCVSFWVKLGDDGTTRKLFGIGESSGENHSIYRTTKNRWFFLNNDPGGVTNVLEIHSDTDSAVVSAGWHHVMASWKNNISGGRHVYINGQNQLNVGVQLVSLNDYSGGYNRFGSSADGTNTGKMLGLVADFWWTRNYIDLSIQSNRELFFKNGRAVYLGENGEIPMAVATPAQERPDVYLSAQNNNITINLGSGPNVNVLAGSFTYTTADGIYYD